MRNFRLILTAALAIVVCAFYAQAALAQVVLPTAPAADRATQGGVTAGASLPGENGSPLEPYLVTWLLPVSGILTAFVLVSVDRNLRTRYR